MRYFPILKLQANPKKLVVSLLCLNISLEIKSYSFWRNVSKRNCKKKRNWKEREGKKKQCEEEVEQKQLLETVARGRGRDWRGRERGKMGFQVQQSDSSHVTRMFPVQKPLLDVKCIYSSSTGSDESDCALCPVCKLSEDAVWSWVACDAYLQNMV